MVVEILSSNISPVLKILLGINCAAFVLFAYDKWCAQKFYRRVPERRLLAMALMGGTPAIVLGQYLLRHKTRKQPFGKILLLILIVQLLVAGLAGANSVYDLIWE